MKQIMPVVSFVLVVLLSACQPAITPGGTDTPAAGYVKGVITAKGSVWVNGVEYDTSASSVVVDGVTATDAGLQVGMTIELNYTLDASGKAVADAVDYESSIKGFVDATSIDTAAGSFTVLGQKVLVGLTTVFEGATLATLADGNFVEVSGTVDANKAIVANRIEVKSATEDAKIRGVVSALQGNTFLLTTEEGLAFTVTATGTLRSTIVEGASVRIEFKLADVVLATRTITVAADKIEARERKVKHEEGGKAEVEGVVTGYAVDANTMTFTVDGQAVSAAVSAVVGSATVGNGDRVEVKGEITNDVLVATKIKVKKDDTELAEKDGNVTAVDPVAKTFTLDNVVYTVDASTLFDGDNLEPSSNPIELIQVGDKLEVKYDDSTDAHMVVKVEIKA